MTRRQKLIQAQKIIDKYIKILEKIPVGGKIDPKVAKELGIPEKVSSIIERAYRQGKLKGITKARIAAKDVEKEFPKLTGRDREFVQLANLEVEQNFSNILNKQRTAYTRKTVEALKRDLNLVGETFKDEPIPRHWIATELRKITKDSRQDWDMVVRTELKNNQLQGMASSILDGSSPYSNDREETMVFKRPMPNACKHCIRLYLEKDGRTPKLFKLSELMANGTNIGRKAADWKATLGPIHPWCQCQLGIMPKGCQFDESGQIVIIKKGGGK